VVEDPLKATTGFILEKNGGPWEPIKTEVSGKNIFASAKRNLKHSRPERSFKLGDTYNWGVGSYDAEGANTFTPIMNLILDSGYEEPKPESVIPDISSEEEPKK